MLFAIAASTAAIVALLYTCLSVAIEYSTHLSQTKRYSNAYGYGNWSEFMREFNIRADQWGREPNWPESWFIYDPAEASNTSEIHSLIIRFDGNGMLLTPVAFMRFQRWVKANALVAAKNPRVRWGR